MGKRLGWNYARHTLTGVRPPKVGDYKKNGPVKKRRTCKLIKILDPKSNDGNCSCTSITECKIIKE